ncbi:MULTISPECIES: extracellular solute-binding protein [unclassified Paenibacillus]|uniref:extracellular solute-binding protein n=1 Tax=unclassified Paenibacillus TaxID=185978 RepID=UPI002F41A048
MKKITSIALTAVLSATLLAGCGGKADPKPAASNNPSESSNPSPEATDQKKEPTKFSISFSTGGNKYFESSADINKDKWVLELEKLTNTDLDIIPIPHKEFDQKMSLIFAGNTVPDVVGNLRGGPTTPSMSGSVEAGVFMPLDDLLKEHAPNLMAQVTEDAWEYVKHDGKIYGIPSWLENPARRATFLRMDLLEKTGLPLPKTVDEYMDVLRAFKKLGVENPYQYRENFKYADTFFGAYDVMPYQLEVVGDEVLPKFFDVENMTKALEAYKTMYDEGLIPADFASVTQADYNRNLSAGKAGMWTSNADGLLNWRSKAREADPNAKIDIVPSPSGYEGAGGHLLASPISTTYFINSKVPKEKAIEIIKFFDWMLTEEADMFFTFGIEGENYTKEGDKINYKLPETEGGVDEQGFRQSQLWFVHELTYNKKFVELNPDGPDLIAGFDNILSKEGVGTIVFNPNLESYNKYPDLAAGGDTASKFIVDNIIKIIYGKAPVSDWPKVIEEWKKKGGNEIIKEATERYRNNDGVVYQGRKQ